MGWTNFFSRNTILSFAAKHLHGIGPCVRRPTHLSSLESFYRLCANKPNDHPSSQGSNRSHCDGRQVVSSTLPKSQQSFVLLERFVLYVGKTIFQHFVCECLPRQLLKMLFIINTNFCLRFMQSRGIDPSDRCTFLKSLVCWLPSIWAYYCSWPCLKIKKYKAVWTSIPVKTFHWVAVNVCYA